MSVLAPLPRVRDRARVTRVAACLCALVLALAAQGLAAQGWEAGTDGLLPIPPLAARVTDLTHTLSSAQSAGLEAKLADWEGRTSNQLVVLVVPTTKPEPIESYALRVVERWKIGRKGQDNGALFLVAKDDRKMRIEVGYGLEGVLTDVTSRRIIAETVAPAFREGNFAAGIDAGVTRIIAVVGEGKPLPPKPANANRSVPGGIDLPTLLAFLFFSVLGGGSILHRIFGRVPGSGVGGAIAALAVWFFLGSLVLSILAGIVGVVVLLLFGSGLGAMGRGGGISTGGGWGGGGGGGLSGGGGFSGGGGSFGGGGASGDW